ncbi:MAG: hypothetical protein EP338_12015 [Bacteroidetes bacterium]|nr:MAG: hypothetical protein EP338_12015 [Bacteroidota bacterium]
MILIIDCGSNKVPSIEYAVDLSCDYQTVGVFDLTEEQLNQAMGVIISGAPILVTEIDLSPYQTAFSWIKDYSKPVLGICFGHQILGLIHGAYAARQKDDRDWQTIELIEDSLLFDKFPFEFKMVEDHCENISVPSDFKLLAVSDACVNEAMEHESKTLFGVQFHPEVSGNMGTLLIENFVNICFNSAKNSPK